ncbi:MAG: hypothetical protein A2W84_01275 [Bacteroidetes bacterium GWC2_40_13]|nr:MAG: hypothetical protein A2W84_01275 [Bacteroidetes bacterium GWC2_40_13]
MKRIIQAVVLIIFFAGLQACLKDEIVIKDPMKFTRPLNLAAPIAKIQVSAQDLLEKIDTSSFFFIDNDGLIHFQMDTSFSAEWTDLIEFDDMSLTQSYDINPNKKVVKEFTDTIVINLDRSQRFDSLFLNNALLDLSVTTPNGLTGNYSISFPELFDDAGQMVVFNGPLGTPATESIDLKNGKMILSNEDGKSFFRITTVANVDVPTTPPTGTNMDVTMNMRNFEPEVVFGYFGKREVINQTQEMDFDFFNNFDFTELVQFKDIRMDVTINNYFGVPIGVYIDTLLFENTVKQEVVPVSIDGDSVMVDAAQYANPVIPSINLLSINAGNSNLIDGINIGPDHIMVEVTGFVNPHEDDSVNFVNTSTKLEASAMIDIPFWFKTSMYERTDTISLDFVKLIGDSARLDYLEEIDLYFTFENWFPFNISAQFYLAQDNGTIVDSIFEDTEPTMFWKSGVIDNSGVVTSPSTTHVDIQMLHDKAVNIYRNEVKKLFIKSRLSTGDAENPDFVKLLESYELKAKLSLEVKSGEISN